MSRLSNTTLLLITIFTLFLSVFLLVANQAKPEKFREGTLVLLPSGDTATVIRKEGPYRLYVRNNTVRFSDNTMFRNKHEIVRVADVRILTQ